MSRDKGTRVRVRRAIQKTHAILSETAIVLLLNTEKIAVLGARRRPGAMHPARSAGRRRMG